jgi:hypothetical protein
MPLKNYVTKIKLTESFWHHARAVLVGVHWPFSACVQLDHACFSDKVF